MAFRLLHAHQAPPTNFVQHFFDFIQQNDVDILNIGSLFGIMEEMRNIPSPFNGVQILMN